MVDGTNKYLYVNNDPVNLVDPWGYSILDGLPVINPGLPPSPGLPGFPGLPGLPNVVPPVNYAGKGNSSDGDPLRPNETGDALSSREADRNGDKITEGKELTPEEAVDRLKDGKDIISDTEAEAKAAATGAGAGKSPVGPENHGVNPRTGIPKPGDWKNHYHTNGHGKGHSWY
jgi:hypothetical protein